MACQVFLNGLTTVYFQLAKWLPDNDGPSLMADNVITQYYIVRHICIILSSLKVLSYQLNVCLTCGQIIKRYICPVYMSDMKRLPSLVTANFVFILF